LHTYCNLIENIAVGEKMKARGKRKEKKKD
jgi:hypothetical protein